MTAARRIPRGPGNVGVVTVTAIRHIEGVVSTNIAAGPEAAIINGVPVSEPMGLARPPADGDRKVRAYSESCEAHAPAPRSPGPISGGGGGGGRARQGQRRRGDFRDLECPVPAMGSSRIPGVPVNGGA